MEKNQGYNPIESYKSIIDYTDPDDPETRCIRHQVAIIRIMFGDRGTFKLYLKDLYAIVGKAVEYLVSTGQYHTQGNPVLAMHKNTEFDPGPKCFIP